MHLMKVLHMFIKTSLIMENAKREMPSFIKKTTLQLNYKLSGRLVVQSQ